MIDRGVALLALAVMTVAGAPSAQAQTASGGESALRVVAPRAELKWSATGRLLGHLERGTTVERLGARGGWTRALVRGWMRSSGLAEIAGGFEVEPERLPIRDDPDGEELGALVQGVDVRRIGGSGEWLRIEMIGWMADSTVSEIAPTRPDEPEREATAGRREGADGPALTGRLSRRSALRGAPEGSELARLPEGTVVRAHETRGGWTRVTVEGWVPEGAVEAGGATEVDPEIVAGAPPEVFVGREVSWTLEHVALQTAEEWRTDMLPGETFDLARVPGSAGLYVYLALPDRLVPAFRDLEPFATIRVEGRVRTGRSSLTGVPVLDVTRLHR
ncbi:MAG: hypothetical protein R3326_05870 [Gemmatimonadota bacterium]|nr:hypothetical protein [Gemmatimonadota bacterium]